MAHTSVQFIPNALLRLCVLLMVTLYPVLYTDAQSVTEVINAHRQWMATHTPQVKRMTDKQLLCQAAEYATYDVRDPHILPILNAAASIVPSAHAYRQWYESGQVDTLYARHLAMLHDIYQTLRAKYGEGDTATVACLDCYVSVLDNVSDVTSFSQKCIDMQRRVVANHPSRSAKARLLTLRLRHYMYIQRNKLIISPLDYTDILQIERDALMLYPIKDTEISEERAQLYLALADVMGAISPEAEWIEARRRYPVPVGVTTCLDTVGNQMEALCYYDAACTLLETLLSAGHPAYITALMKRTEFVTNYLHNEEEAEEYQNNLLQYVQTYYPYGSVQEAQARLNLWGIKALSGKEIADIILANSRLATLQTALGVDNPYYIMDLYSLILCAAPNAPAMATSLMDDLVTILQRIYDPESVVTCYIMRVATLVKDHLPQSADWTSRRINMFKKCARPDALSICCGRMLVSDLFARQSDYTEALAIQTIVRDLCYKMYGVGAYPSCMAELSRIDIRTRCHPTDKSIGDEYNQLIAKMRTQDYDTQQVTDSYATWASLCMGDDALSRRLLRELIQPIGQDDNLSTQARYRWNMVNSLYSDSAIQAHDDQLRMASEAMSLMDTTRDSLAMIPNNYLQAACWLCLKGKFDDAVNYLDRGLEICDRQMTGFTQDYADMLMQKIHILADNKHDISGAQTLVTDNLNTLLASKLTITATELSFLWECYRMMKSWHSQEDYTFMASYLLPLIQQTYTYYMQSGQQADIRYTRVLDAIQELTNLTAMCARATKTLKEEQSKATEQQKKQADQFLQNARQMISDELIKIIKGFPQYRADYRHCPEYSQCLMVMMQYYQEIDPNKSLVEKYIKEYVQIAQEATNTYAYMDALTLMGDYYNDDARYAEALECYVKAYALIAQVPQITAEDQLRMLGQLSGCYRRIGDTSNARVYAQLYYQMMKEILGNNFKFMTEEEQTNYMALHPNPSVLIDLLLDAIPEQLTSVSYDAILYRTGMQLRSQQSLQRAIATSHNAVLIHAADSLMDMKREAKLITTDYINGNSETNNANSNRLARLQRNINNLEHAIITEAKPYWHDNTDSLSWQMVRDHLDKDQAAVEFVFSNQMLCALVLRHNSLAPQVVPLVCGDSLVTRIESFHAKTPTTLARRLYRDSDTWMYNHLWRPMEASLVGAKTVYYATPGILSQLAFAAFSCGDGTYLSDHYTLSLLSTTAEVGTRSKGSTPTSLLAMGAIYYSPNQSQEIKAGKVPTKRGDDETTFDDFSDRATVGTHFSYLPHTAHEVGIIDSLFAKRQHKLFTGDNASERTLRQLSLTHPEVIHLATHGFFIANEQKIRQIPFFKKYTQSGFVPSMQRAGITLTDAESTWCGADNPEDNDGILTATEVSGLDLQGTLLVTLSACETALGNYSIEGVWGLPRAFKQAGVKSLLVSLWNVDDKSTAEFMTTFYHQWLAGCTLSQAFHIAVETIRSRYKSPYYWAPFVIIDAGD